MFDETLMKELLNMKEADGCGVAIESTCSMTGRPRMLLSEAPPAVWRSYALLLAYRHYP